MIFLCLICYPLRQILNTWHETELDVQSSICIFLISKQKIYMTHQGSSGIPKPDPCLFTEYKRYTRGTVHITPSSTNVTMLHTHLHKEAQMCFCLHHTTGEAQQHPIQKNNCIYSRTRRTAVLLFCTLPCSSIKLFVC